jgi:hypothetical protein
MSSPFLPKLLDGKEATFLRLEGSDQFVVEVEGEERMVSRDEWRSLPDQTPTKRDRVYHLDHHRGKHRRTAS